MKVTKQSGEQEDFNKEKLCHSLEEAGAEPDLVEEVCETVAGTIEPGVSTTKIFRTALRTLVKRNTKAAVRYNVRQGVADLGPAGFLFEQFVEALLRALGYETERGVYRQGECVEHEIDVIAHKNDGEYIVVEVKYRNERSIKTHIDDVMYADARREDINRRRQGEVAMWFFTNTKFTSKSIQYGKCRSIRMTGWDYPDGEGLEDLTERFALYPVTSLPSVNKKARTIFAEHNMMLAQDVAVYSAQSLHDQFGIPKDRARKIAREAQALLYKE